MKKFASILLTLALILSLASPALADDMINIGVIQFAEHGSLDNCYQGFVEGLAEEGFVDEWLAVMAPVFIGRSEISNALRGTAIRGKCLMVENDSFFSVALSEYAR